MRTTFSRVNRQAPFPFMKTALALLISLFVVAEAHARIHRPWSYNDLATNATLVVIATPTGVAETSEVATLPEIVSVFPDGHKEPVMGKGLETTFQILTVLRGECATNSLVLHHYLEVGKPVSTASAGLVFFEPNDKRQYLMFLKKEADGRYVTVSDQTDASDSISLVLPYHPHFQLVDPTRDPTHYPTHD